MFPLRVFSACAPSLCCRYSALGSGSLCDSASWGHADILEMEGLQEADPRPQKKAWVFQAVTRDVLFDLPVCAKRELKYGHICGGRWGRECSLQAREEFKASCSCRILENMEDGSSWEFIEAGGKATYQWGKGKQLFLLSAQTLVLNYTWSAEWIVFGSGNRIGLQAWEEGWFSLTLTAPSFA